MADENLASRSQDCRWNAGTVAIKSKRLKLTNSVFRDNDQTEGGRVKCRNAVVSHRMAQCRTQPHVNCRVQSFGLIMDSFCEMKIKWVNEMGLGSLLHMRGKSLPRGLCYWLMTKVDPLNHVFIASVGREYPLHKNQVHWVLGIPFGPKRVPRKADGLQAFVDELYDKYGVVTEGKTRYLSMARMMEMVERDCSLEDELDFKTAFLALALADVLCPTTCMRLARNLLPALSVAKEAAVYDWSGLVLEKLMCSARSFAINFYTHGYAKGCGGCTYFLAIFYLDRLNRLPMQWGVFPRIRVWENAEVNKAKNEDKLQHVVGSDYGRIEFLDVAYGEQHPRVARDTLGPQSLATEVARHLAVQGLLEGVMENAVQGEDQLVADAHSKKRKGRRKGPADNSNPYLRKLAKKARAEASTRDPLGGTGPSNENDAHNTGGVLGQQHGELRDRLEREESMGIESGGGRGKVSNSDHELEKSFAEEPVSDGAVHNVVTSLVENTYGPLPSSGSAYIWGRQSFSGQRFVSDEVLDSGWCSHNLEMNFNNADMDLGLEADHGDEEGSIAHSGPRPKLEAGEEVRADDNDNFSNEPDKKKICLVNAFAEQGKIAKSASVKSGSNTHDDKFVIINDADEDEKAKDDLDPVEVLGSKLLQFEASINKLQKVVSKMQAKKFKSKVKKELACVVKDR